MFKNLFKRNWETSTFDQTKKIISWDNGLKSMIKVLFEEKSDSKTENEIEYIPPNLLTEEDINNLPNITDWEELVEMKSRTNWTQSKYKWEIIEQRMFEILPDQLLTIWETLDDVETLLEMNHDLGYNKEFNKRIEEKLLSLLPLLLPKTKDLKLLDSWCTRVGYFYRWWKEQNRPLETMVENRLKDIIWWMSWIERSNTKDTFKNSSNNVVGLIDQKELEIILEQKKWNKLYQRLDEYKLFKEWLKKQTEEGIYKLIQNREIIFTPKDIYDITEKLWKKQTIISEQITESLLSYLSDTIN